MWIETKCGDCRTNFRIAAKYSGRRVRCKKCGGVFRVPGEKVDLASAAVTPSSNKSNSSAARPPERVSESGPVAGEVDLSVLLDEELSAKSYEAPLPRITRNRSRAAESESAPAKKK